MESSRTFSYEVVRDEVMPDSKVEFRVHRRTHQADLWFPMALERQLKCAKALVSCARERESYGKDCRSSNGIEPW